MQSKKDINFFSVTKVKFYLKKKYFAGYATELNSIRNKIITICSIFTFAEKFLILSIVLSWTEVVAALMQAGISKIAVVSVKSRIVSIHRPSQIGIPHAFLIVVH